jgi:hypothetical protein
VNPPKYTVAINAYLRSVVVAITDWFATDWLLRSAV